MKVVTRYLDSTGTTGERPKLGIVLLHVGGPDTSESIASFYHDLFSESDVLPLGLGEMMRGQRIRSWLEENEKEIVNQYSFVGARSPIADLAASQALALENHLNGRPVMAPRAGGKHLVLAAQRFGRDPIDSVIGEFDRAGVEHLVAVSLYPQSSRGLSGICIDEMVRALKGTRLAKRTSVVESYHDHPRYLDAMTVRMRRTFDLVPPALRDEIFLLFSVHSPPHARAKDDEYLDQIETTAQTLMQVAGYDESRSAVAFQGFRAPCRQLEPSVREFVLERARAGVRAMVTVPVSYVTDTFETLYDLDIDAYKAGAENGIKQMRRVPSLNADPLFIGLLAEVAKYAAPENI